MADNKAQIVIGAENRAEGVLRQVRAQLGGLAGDVNLTQRAFGGLGGALAGALTGAGLAAFFKNTADGLDRLNDVADVTGATIENISALEDVAARTGTSIDTIEGALVKLNLQLSAADGKNGVSVALKQIGLDAEQLKKVDPAEALRLTAVALGQFADDGDKARLVQNIFGKSVREVGSFLKDLATQTKLTATVTAEQTREAEKFNQQLLALNKNLTDASRSISGPFIESLNDAIDKFREGSQEGKGFFATLGSAIKAEADKNESRILTEQLSGINAELDKLRDSGLADTEVDFFGRRTVDKLKRDAAQVREELERIRGPQLGRRPANEGGGGFERRIGGGPAEADKTPKRAARDRGIAGLAIDRAEAFRQSELATQALVDEALATARLSSAEAIRQTGLKAIAADQDRLNQLIAATPSAAFDRQQEDIQLLRKAYEAAEISVEQYAEAVAALSPPTKQLTSDIDEFAKQAARNIQDQLGTSLFEAASGNFKNIGDDFSRLLLRMGSEAIAAELGKKLFGEVGKDGQGLNGGLLGDVIGLLGGSGGKKTTGDFARMDRGQGSSTAGFLGTIASFFSGAYADGGFIPPGRFGITGEAGPEITFGGRSGATVIPVGAGSQRPVNYSPTFVLPAQGASRETQNQIAAKAYAGALRAFSRSS